MSVKPLYCLQCGFPLGGRPGLKETDGVCSACINAEKKKNIDFEARQQWLTEYICENKGNGVYDCLIAVSGGKDSHMIVKRLMQNHGIKNPLLVTTLDEFTQTKAGEHNLKNIAEYFDVDHIYFRYKPQTCKKEMLEGFVSKLNPLELLDERMVAGDGVPMVIAKKFGIKLVFYGENAAFEYGNSPDLDILHPLSDKDTKYIFMGAIYPYSIADSLREARSVGFKDLDDFNEWNRYTVENYTQQDSIGYLGHQWCKFVKFGAQRVADIACRMVREGALSREQALLYIKERDFILDGLAKKDICRAMDITEEYFDSIVDKHANLDLVKKDIDGVWKRKEFVGDVDNRNYE